MAEKDAIGAIDQAIAALKAARKALVLSSRQAKSAPKTLASARPAAKRVLSEESRQRIVDAQRKRWASVRKAAKKAARKSA